MSGRMEVTMFNEVSGNIRGIAAAFFTIEGKRETRIAHAYITTEPSVDDVTLDIPRHVSFSQIDELTALINRFYNEIAGLNN